MMPELTPDQVTAALEAKAILRDGQGRLALTDSELADALQISTVAAIRIFKNPERIDKAPSAPTLQLLLLTEAVVEALVLMRTGQADEARRVLQALMTPPLKRHIRDRAPGG
jgi:hypothetical protein